MKKTGMDAEHESPLITSPTENEVLMRGLLVALQPLMLNLMLILHQVQFLSAP